MRLIAISSPHKLLTFAYLHHAFAICIFAAVSTLSYFEDRQMKRLIVLVWVLAMANCAAAQTFTGKVISIYDGDTGVVKKADGTEVKIRFVFCDAPEINQPAGVAARDFVRALCLDKDVTVRTEGTDDYGRVLGEIMVGSDSVNKKVIEKGWGWWFYHYHSDVSLGHLEAKAKSEKLGLWADRNPIFPRNWRAGARVSGNSGGGTGDTPAADDTAGDASGDGDDGSPSTVSSSVFIMALMPNPVGVDLNNETVIIANRTEVEIAVDGWRLEDDDDGGLALTGTIPAGGTRTIRLTTALSLGNEGDVVRLRKPGGDVVHELSYDEAKSGRFILGK